MNDADLEAIAVYLKDQPGNGEGDTQSVVKPDEKAMKIGAAIYADECSGCHAADGKGTAGLFPSLDGSPVVQQTDPTSLLHVVLRGARSVATDGAPTASAMPQFAWLLTDDQVAAVLTYIRNTWGNAAPPVSAAKSATPGTHSSSGATERRPGSGVRRRRDKRSESATTAIRPKAST